MRESKWDDALLERLKELYLNQGLSTVEIAKILGFTKNAIIGKIHRSGLLRQVEETKEYKSKFIRRVPEKFIQKAKGTYKLEELESNMCVWPYGDEDEFTFCGDIVFEDKPYCQEHLALVYLPPKRIGKRKPSEVYTEADMEADMEEAEDEDIEAEVEAEIEEEAK